MELAFACSYYKDKRKNFKRDCKAIFLGFNDNIFHILHHDAVRYEIIESDLFPVESLHEVISERELNFSC